MGQNDNGEGARKRSNPPPLQGQSPPQWQSSPPPPPPPPPSHGRASQSLSGPPPTQGRASLSGPTPSQGRASLSGPTPSQGRASLSLSGQPPRKGPFRKPRRSLPPPTPVSAPTRSIDPGADYDEPESFWQSFSKGIYNPQTGEVFCRTGKSWILILAYSAMYLVFLATFTLICLYIALVIIKTQVDFNTYEPKIKLLTYPVHGIGLSATPTSEGSAPLIWYKNGEKADYEKYIQAIDKFLETNRRKREVSNLGPCGEFPYGYGETPCVIVRINKQYNWAGKPLHFNSTIAKSAPAEVQTWMKADRTKLWLQCTGYHSYDKEHIGRIKYYPDPPGFDASRFPLEAHTNSPLVAVQISEFTMGLSLAIECKLWYDTGPSKIDFILYVAPGEKNIAVNRVVG